MKLQAILLPLYVAFASSVKLLAREDTCPRDNCWIAVWGSEDDDDIVTAAIDCQNHQTTTFLTNTYSVATITILAHTTETTVVSCSLPGFKWPTPPPISGGTLGKLKARQAGIVSYSTTTIVGPIPTSAVVGCETSDAIYSGACACKNIESSTLSINGPMITTTSTATTTSTSTVTSTASCSSSAVITLSHSSSTVVTTMTFTSSAGTGTDTGTGTATGTVLFSSTSLSSTTGFNTTTTPSSTLSSATMIFNTTLTHSTTPTPTCATPGYILCNNTCLNATSDAQNCGSCGNKCGNGVICFNGVCARRPLDPPCDTNCTYRRECNTGIGGTSCSCARDSGGYGICFDANEYQCLSTTLKCKATADCKLGALCIKSICSEGPSVCSNTTEAQADGICVTNTGCGAQGPVDFGALVRFEKQQQRKRMVGEFNW